MVKYSNTVRAKSFVYWRKRVLSNLNSIPLNSLLRNPKLLPSKQGVYIMFRVDDGYPYVGESVNVSRRLIEHSVVNYPKQYIEGTIEKIYEHTSKNISKEYIGKDRIRSKFKGYIERNYFGADKISIHIIENGTDRESTSFQKVISKCSNVLEGEFESTAGDSKGICIWQRKPFW